MLSTPNSTAKRDTPWSYTAPPIKKSKKPAGRPQARCYQCNLDFAFRKLLTEHYINSPHGSDGKSHCPYCNHAVGGWKTLQAHSKSKHGVDLAPIGSGGFYKKRTSMSQFMCPVVGCESGSPTSKALIAHVKDHDLEADVEKILVGQYEGARLSDWEWEGRDQVVAEEEDAGLDQVEVEETAAEDKGDESCGGQNEVREDRGREEERVAWHRARVQAWEFLQELQDKRLLGAALRTGREWRSTESR